MLGLDKQTQEAGCHQCEQMQEQEVPSVLSSLLTSLHTVNSKSVNEFLSWGVGMGDECGCGCAYVCSCWIELAQYVTVLL